MDEMVGTAVANVEMGLYEPKTQLAGAVAIIDLEGIKWSHVTSTVQHLFLGGRMMDWIQVLTYKNSYFMIRQIFPRLPSPGATRD